MRTADFGLAFERDTAVLELASLLNQFPGIKTQRFCRDGEDELAHVVFTGPFDKLMSLCDRLHPQLSHETDDAVDAPGQLVLMFDCDLTILGELRFAPTSLGRLIQLITELLSCPPVYADHLTVNEPVAAIAAQSRM